MYIYCISVYVYTVCIYIYVEIESRRDKGFYTHEYMSGIGVRVRVNETNVSTLKPMK